MFATPELGMYPSPTLSTGSGGPATPSPYLASGLFGYPAMFDPGHLAAGGLPNVTGWDPSRTPCMQVSVIPADAEDEPEQQGATQAADAIIDARARSLQLRLPTPKKARLARGAADDRLRGIGLDLGLGLGSLDAPGADGNGHIDPALLMAGPAYSMDVDLDEDPDADADADEGGLDAHFLLRLAAWDTPPPAPPPSPGLGPLPVGKTKAMLFGDEAQRAVDADARCRATRWESLDAWLVPSSSAGSDGLGPV
ncbi:hypothetical protein BC834DRAFT_862254 [Gloeopeniophorella convolvens]|nr:hypothetical protein BC834DRAFT_862254 [Gloeopeniophorella convolvens]